MRYKLKKMEQKTIAWIGIVIMIIVGWAQITNFLTSLFKGLPEVLNSIPPLVLLGLVIGIIYSLGHKE